MAVRKKYQSDVEAILARRYDNGSDFWTTGYNQKVCKKGLGGGILQDNKKLLKEGGTAYGKGYHDSERRVNTRV